MQSRKSHSVLVTMARLIIACILQVVSLAGCQPGSTPALQRTGTAASGGLEILAMQRVSQVDYVFEPHIAVDPVNPEHLAAVVIASPDFECLSCRMNLVLYTSTNGGDTWVEQWPFGSSRRSGDGVVSFGPDGTLYLVGLYNTSIALQRSDNDDQLTFTDPYRISSDGSDCDKPWLTIDPHSGILYVTYGAMRGSGVRSSIYFQRSIDDGNTWSEPVDAWQNDGRIPPFGSQVILGDGDNLAIAWVWSKDRRAMPSGVWVTTSPDGGKSFSTPKQIAETWGIISTTAYNGTYYIFFRRGTEQTQELVAAISRDGGATWEFSVVNGDVSLYFDVDKAPGVNVAPDGTLDVVFYAHGDGAPDCIDLDAWYNRDEGGWIDGCVYDVYYTSSVDGGRTFLPPIQLNKIPIIGSRFLRTSGFSRPGEYIGIASTDEYAFPIWIDTQESDGTQAYTVRIKR